MTIGLSHYLTVAAILFTLGIFGIFLNRKNVIVILMCDRADAARGEHQSRRLLGRFTTTSSARSSPCIVLTVAAAEAAIGLAILVVYFRNRGTIDVADIDLMKG